MKVLVAMDSSIYAEEMLEQLTARPWPVDAEFQVVTAVNQPPNWEVEEELMHQCKVILDRRVEYLAKRMPETKVTGKVLEGTAAREITRMAEEWNADLVVIGSHGDTGKRQRELGSVAAEVVNRAGCTVEVVKLRHLAKKKSDAKTEHCGAL